MLLVAPMVPQLASTTLGVPPGQVTVSAPVVLSATIVAIVVQELSFATTPLVPPMSI